MESLNEWKLVHRHKSFTDGLGLSSQEKFVQSANLIILHDRLCRSLLLIESDSVVYGMFSWKYKRADGWYIDISKTFVFKCAVNSVHLPSTANIPVSDVKFVRPKLLSDAEVNLEINTERYSKWNQL